MFWKKKPQVELQGRFWMTDDACAAGFLDDTSALLQAGVHVMIVTHFADTHLRVAESLRSRTVTGSLVSVPKDLAPNALLAACGPQTVPMIPFPALRLASPFPTPRERSRVRCVVVVPETYPTRMRDLLVEEFAASLPFTTALRFYVSMQSPLMRRFGGEQIVSMMERLGQEEHEVIEHVFLTRSFQSAQKRLSRLVKEDHWAASIDEWFAMNERVLGNAR